MTPVFPTSAGNFTWAIGPALGTSTFTASQTATPPVSSSIVIPNADANRAGNAGSALPASVRVLADFETANAVVEEHLVGGPDGVAPQRVVDVDAFFRAEHIGAIQTL